MLAQAIDDGAYTTRYQLAFDAGNLRLVPNGQQLLGTMSVSGFGMATVHRGDVIEATGVVYPTHGNNQASMSFASLRLLRRSPSRIERWRRSFVAGMQTALPEPLASFGLGLLVGQRNTLPLDVSQALLMVGLTHIIAVSGYNLTIILDGSRRLFARRSKFQAAAACVGLSLLFIAFAGSNPSLIRAAWVGGLSLAAWYYGRTVRPAALLIVAAAVTAFLNPLELWGNVSWWLSFLAFAGILLLAPPLTRRLFGAREPPLLIAILIESFCAEILTVPYVLHVFGQISFVGLAANVLVVAFVPLAMLLALIAGLAGWLLSPIAGWFAWPARQLLTYMLDIANLLARMPHAFAQHIGLSTLGMLCLYGAVAEVLVVLWHKYGKNAKITETEMTVAERSKT